MDQPEKARLAEACRGMDAETAQRVIAAQIRATEARRNQQLRESGRRLATVGEVLRSLKFRCRTTSDLNLVEPYTQTECALAMAMKDAGLSYQHRANVAGLTADFWVTGNMGFGMAVLCTEAGRAGADGIRRRGMMTFEFTDRALISDIRQCAKAIAEILCGDTK